jgi:hypothetical protein
VAAVVTLITSVLLLFYFYRDDDELFGLIDLFDLAIEGNIPTLSAKI